MFVQQNDKNQKAGSRQWIQLVMLENFAKLDTLRRLVEFRQHFLTSFILLITNCARHRMITYTYYLRNYAHESLTLIYGYLHLFLLSSKGRVLQKLCFLCCLLTAIFPRRNFLIEGIFSLDYPFNCENLTVTDSFKGSIEKKIRLKISLDRKITLSGKWHLCR